MKSMRLSTIAAALMVAMPLYAQTADPVQPKLESDKPTKNAEITAAKKT